MRHMVTFSVGLLGLIYGLTASLYAQESRLENNRPFVFDTSSRLFVTVEKHEVRVEIMVKGAPLVRWLDFSADDGTLAIDQQTRFKKQALDVVKDRFVLSLEGIPATPGMTRADFLTIGDTNSVVKDVATNESVADAVLGLTYIFPVGEVPDYFQFVWTTFPIGIRRMPAQIRMQDHVQQFELNQYMTTIDWNSGDLNFKLPVIAPVPVRKKNRLGRPKLDEQAAIQVVGQLLTNIYSAFEYQDEAAIYDQLAISVSGKQIEAIYLEQRKRMETVSRGGPRMKIDAVSMCHVGELVRSGQTFEVKSQWDVSGTVSHFGHTHKRRNRYEAKLTLVSINKQWKITDIEVLDEKRILKRI